MSASYPSAAKSFTSRSAGQTVASAIVNDLQDEVNAVETDLVAGKVGGIGVARLTTNTFTGVQIFPGGALAAVAVGVGAANVGLYASSTSTLEVAAAGVKAMGITATWITSAVQPRCSVWNNAVQSVPNNAATALTFDSETYDVGGLHSTSVNPSRVTIPTGADGLYFIVGESYFTGSAVGTRRDVYIYVNGAVVRDVIVPPNANAVKPQVTVVTPLVATDYVELFALQDSGGALNLGNASESQGSRLTVAKLW